MWIGVKAWFQAACSARRCSCSVLMGLRYLRAEQRRMRPYSSSIQEVISRISLPRVGVPLSDWLSYFILQGKGGRLCPGFIRACPVLSVEADAVFSCCGTIRNFTGDPGPDERWSPLLCKEVAHGHSFLCCTDFDGSGPIRVSYLELAIFR